MPRPLDDIQAAIRRREEREAELKALMEREQWILSTPGKLLPNTYGGRKRGTPRTAKTLAEVAARAKRPPRLGHKRAAKPS